tara:strand:+ start:42 stop:224 length:183 start_codon:yes stop_codon:yes gene_type:complete
MKKKDREWLKKNKPWRYDDLYGDPVTGHIDAGGDFFKAVICIIVVIGVISLILFYLNKCI